ncbi:MAG: diguanylate cyclase [Acidimicrobiales bacterium]
MRKRHFVALVVALVMLPAFTYLALDMLWEGEVPSPSYLLTGAVFVLSSAALAYLLVRTVLRNEVSVPLQAISERTEAASRGELKAVPALEKTGSRDIDRLVDSLNELFARLVAYVDDLETSRRQFRESVDRLGTVLASTHDRGTILDATVQAVVSIARAEKGIFWETKGKSLVARLASGADEHLGLSLQRRVGLAGWVGHHDLPSIADDRHDLHPAEPSAPTAMAVPVHSQGKVFGVLAVYGRDGAPSFTDDDLVTLRSLVNQAEAAIENTFLHEEASRLSITDALTGVWNRRHFNLRLAEEFERSARFVEPFGLLLLDVDGFKPINDVYGHPAGDFVLVELARRLQDVTRSVDVVARFGGEEFALILPRTGADGARLAAEKIRAAVARETFDAIGQNVPVTVSVGAAVYPESGVDARTLLAAADEALYDAKAGGKNRVVVAQRSTVPQD